jgi:iron complex outermembrane receptor protein
VNTKKTTFTKAQILIAPLLLTSLLQPNPALANDESLWDMSLEELGQIRVTTLASGTATPLDKAAAVATVITEEDILAMGARDIEEVLETVPGMHISKHPIDYTPKFNIRGITSIYTAETLILINGIPISSLYIGAPSLVWAGMPIKSVKKIEVIRGPGSALYGADAFAGVINITTKSAEDMPKGEAGFSSGSFNTKNAWISYGNRENAIDLAFTLEYSETDGFKELVKADAQTFFDGLAGTSASLAPGTTNTGKQMIDARLELSQQNWTMHLGYQGRDKVESAVGIAEALSPSGYFTSDRINTDFTYYFNDLAKDLKLKNTLSYYYNDQQVGKNNVLFPQGAFGFTTDIVGNPEFKEQQARYNLDIEYIGFENHILRAGAGYFWGDIFEVTEQKNYFNTNPPSQRPGGIEEVAGTSEVFLPEKDRTSTSLYIQDEWLFTDNWALTTGIRYDNYSDFGDTINPRAALVWATTDSITTKLLYGRAFRAPSFVELFAINNPIVAGNPKLSPEKIDTYELAISQQISTNLNYATNFFYYTIDDFITNVAGRWENTGERTGYGTEVEFDYSPTKKLRLLANISIQKSKDDIENDDVGETPNYQFYTRTEWKASDKWLISPQLNWVGSQKRGPTDSRTNSVPHYTTVDLTIRQFDVFNDLDISLSIRNLFDRDIYEPSLSPGSFIPGDYPMAGRSIYGEVAYQF